MAFQQLESIGRGSIIDKIKCLKIPEISAIGPMYISWIKPYPTVKPSIFRNQLFFPHYPLVWLGNGYSIRVDQILQCPKERNCILSWLCAWFQCFLVGNGMSATGYMHTYIQNHEYINTVYVYCVLKYINARFSVESHIISPNVMGMYLSWSVMWKHNDYTWIWSP